MRVLMLIVVSVFLGDAAYAQSFFTPSSTIKPQAGAYSTGWHYGRITFKVVSYTEQGSTGKKKEDWYNVLFEKAFGSQTPGGTFAITLDLCDSSGCAKPVARKLIAAFSKTANQPVKQSDFLSNVSAVGTAIANVFTGGAEATPIAGATVETSFISNGDDLILNHLIAQPKDNNYTVRLTITSIDQVFVTKGILPDMFTILNSTANDPIIKAALAAVPGASTIPVVTQAATNMAEKLLASPAYAKSVTNEQPIQFVNPEPFPRFVQYNIPAKSGSAGDCNRAAELRKNCVILQIDASTVRSILGVFDISAGAFKPGSDPRTFRNTAATLLGKDVDDFVASGNESLKKFIAATSVGPYKEDNLGIMCGMMQDMLYKVFTRWDAKALYWSYIDLNWDKIKANTAVSGCLLGLTEREEMRKIGLPLPTL